MRFGSLFSGIGGMDLGMERAGWQCVLQCEADEWRRGVLARHWPEVPRSDDVTRLTLEPGRMDALVGGFPCQDISSANRKGRGLDGERSGLWRHFARLVGEARPRWVVAENAGSRWRAWVPHVRRDLWGLGCASLPLRVCSGAVGAPHKRDRCFVVAHANRDCEPLRAVHEEVARLLAISGRGGHWRQPPPGGFRVDDGTTPGLHRRLAACGNAVVPQVAEVIARAISAAHAAVTH